MSIELNTPMIDLSDLIAAEQAAPNAPTFDDPMPIQAEQSDADFKTCYIQWNRHESQWQAIYHGKVVMRNSSRQYGGNILLRSIENQTNKKVQLMGITHGTIVSEDFKIPNGPEKINVEKIVDGLKGESLNFGKHDLASEFSIGERFAILEKFVSSAAFMATAEPDSMEALAANAMVTITGSGGLGKTYTTKKVLESHGLQRSDDMDIGDIIYGRAKGYAVISGYTTAKALFRKLWEHREGWVVVLDDADEIVTAKIADVQTQYIMIFTSLGQCIRFELEKTRDQGRSTRGVRGIKFKIDTDIVVDADVIDSEEQEILTVSEKGIGKRTTIEEYRLTNRAGSGVIAMKLSPKTGNIVGEVLVDDTQDLMLLTSIGKMIRVDMQTIRKAGRNTSGVIIVNMDKDDKVVSIAKCPKEDEEIELDENGNIIRYNEDGEVIETSKDEEENLLDIIDNKEEE
jgi:hypothetical protein